MKTLTYEFKTIEKHYSNLIYSLAKGQTANMEVIRRMDVFKFYSTLEIFREELERNKNI